MSASILHGMLLVEMDELAYEDETDDEFDEVDDPGEAVFSLDPPVVAFSREGQGYTTLRLQLPPGWYLNELLNRTGGDSKAIAISWAKPSPPVKIDFKAVGPDAWNITLVKEKSDEPLLGRFIMNVTYQPCTDRECRDKESALVDVQLR